MPKYNVIMKSAGCNGVYVGAARGVASIWVYREGNQKESRWLSILKLKISASSLAKHEFSGADAGTMLLHFDSDQTSLPMQPIDSPNTTFPATSQLGAPLFIRLRNLPLRPASITQGLPLLRCDSREKRLIQCVKKVEISDIWGAPTFATPDNHGPRELIRTE